MKLAAIDIGTNSIHMIIAEATHKQSFKIIDRQKEMAKLGVGVFASKYISDRAFKVGIETIHRYIQLAEEMGVDEILTAATSAIREAQNGEKFLREVVAKTGICPRTISGKEEARLIFLAVRNSIALEDDKALVLDIGGGSTEAVVGDRSDLFFRDSMPLGVLRLLDMFENKESVGTEGRGILEAHIQFVAGKVLEKTRDVGFDRVIGTSGTIRTMGEAAHMAAGGKSFEWVNAEVVPLEKICQLTQELLKMKVEERAEVEAVSEKRADAIHLGGVLLVKLLNLAGVEEITLCDASLREGMILDYLERHSQAASAFSNCQNLRYRQAAHLIYKYDADWEENRHTANLALQLFDRTQELHGYGNFEREILEFAALLHNIGMSISFRKHHKNSRFLIKRTAPRGFTNEEILLIGHLARYHCKAKPTKRHKKFKQLSKYHRHLIKRLAGILRISVALNKTKNQRVEQIFCQVSKKTLEINVAGTDNIEVEIWAARRSCEVLAEALERQIKIQDRLQTFSLDPDLR
ncbi:Ppx/GppA family phosphatase [Oscillatoriales cyanobacterium LEGE 11467]|uniref:Ppx/GppA family phosphatase n=1 Tax=Zarconia navalis LEGE 11467 TaxID=1828826 RepID=A0A928ZA66_9CYAN|nr:Ppx/GppA phosphatase family protein [Zarconia navalis]MBE9042398.1 Ppx/GppA family phosphatase [Zarconia navalis LEGE 11467]